MLLEPYKEKKEMKNKTFDAIIAMYDKEINRLALEISNAKRHGDINELIKVCERQDEVLAMFHKTVDIINRIR